MRLTHVLCPVAASPGSNLARAQSTAFEAIRRALRYTADAAPSLEVDFVTPVLDQDRPAVPPFATAAPALTRSVLDVTDIRPARPLPLIGDVLHLAAQHGRGDAVIYTNTDIAPLPHFYELVARLLMDRPAFGITRRLIALEPMDAAELAVMYGQVGLRSRGIDTFVCPRDIAATIDLGHIAIGLPTIDYSTMAAIDAACGFRAVLYRHLHANLHHGTEMVWRQNEPLCTWSRAQSQELVDRLRTAHPSRPRFCLFDTMDAVLHDAKPPSRGPIQKLLISLGVRRRHPEPFDLQPEALPRGADYKRAALEHEGPAPRE